MTTLYKIKSTGQVGELAVAEWTGHSIVSVKLVIGDKLTEWIEWEEIEEMREEVK